MGLNDRAWERLFEKYRIQEEIARNGSFLISADRIREVREPRLMTKFDHRVNLPRIFAENRLAILPVSRGDYVIAPFEAYREFEELSGEVQRVSVPPYLQSLASRFLVSEAIALNCAKACGILSDFLEDEEIAATVSGRMGSGNFEFAIDTPAEKQRLAVCNAQIEIDAAYEGVRFLSLLEAKKYLADDFLIRQLYYPFRAWSGRVGKPVKPVFLVFSNGVFYLYQYRFEDSGDYNSLRLVKQKNYVIATEICLPDIEALLQTVPVVGEPEIPFPQANSMARIVNLAELLGEQPMTRDEIAAEYGFDPRQTNYYTDAGRYLGLMEKTCGGEEKILFRLSALGERVMGLPYRERQLAIAAQILRHKVFRETLKLRLACGEMPDANTVISLMRAAGLHRVGADSTFYRRSSTVTGWISWILGLIAAPLYTSGSSI